jgi:hypothetical protein
MTCKIPLYPLIQPKIILSVLVCRVSIIVYTYKISELETLMWNYRHFLLEGASLVDLISQ